MTTGKRAAGQPKSSDVIRAGLPPGIASLGAGLATNGLLTYAFLALAGRNLSDGSYGALAVVWGLVALLGAGLFQPLQQGLSYASSHRNARGLGSKPVLASSLAIGVRAITAVWVLLAAWWFLGLDDLIDNDASLFVAFLLSLAGFMFTEVYRGIVAGHSRFGSYGASLITEGSVRVVGVVGLIAIGTTAPSAYAGLIAASFFAAALATSFGQRPIAEDGPPVQPHELGQNLRLLLVMSLAESFLLNVGPVAVSILSDLDGEPGRFLNGLVLARIPLMVFQAVKISILPSRTRMVANGESTQLATSTRRLALAVGGFGLATIAGAALLGPLAVSILFADTISALDMTLLSTANALSMLAILLSLTLVACERPTWAAASWIVGIVAFVIVSLALPIEAFRRVEISLIAGFAIATVCLAIATSRSIGQLSESQVSM